MAPIISMPWAGKLPEFRDKLPGESQPEYLNLLGDFKVAAAKQQKVDWLAQGTVTPAPGGLV